MDAKDRETVMKGLECCLKAESSDDCVECPYFNGKTDCVRQRNTDALVLLKEQEPRVLEYSEIEKNPLVWLEDNDKEDVIPALFLQYNGWNAEFAVQAPDEWVDTIIRSSIVIAVEGMYGITWRAWTSRPSLEQMRDTKWEGHNG